MHVELRLEVLLVVVPIYLSRVKAVKIVCGDPLYNPPRKKQVVACRHKAGRLTTSALKLLLLFICSRLGPWSVRKKRKAICNLTESLRCIGATPKCPGQVPAASSGSYMCKCIAVHSFHSHSCDLHLAQLAVQMMSIKAA